MQRELGLEDTAALRHSDLAGIAALEIFLHGAGHCLVDAGTERLSDIEILAGYPQYHGVLPTAGSYSGADVYEPPSAKSNRIGIGPLKSPQRRAGRRSGGGLEAAFAPPLDRRA